MTFPQYNLPRTDPHFQINNILETLVIPSQIAGLACRKLLTCIKVCKAEGKTRVLLFDILVSQEDFMWSCIPEMNSIAFYWKWNNIDVILFLKK